MFSPNLDERTDMGKLTPPRRRHKKESAGNSQPADHLDVGVAAIARTINQTERRTSYWLGQGRIKCAMKIGRLHAAPRRALRAEFGLVD
jgi:hypothetical protein